jgi:hypothetical protein
MNGAFVFGYWNILSYLAGLRWQPALLNCGNIGLSEHNPRCNLTRLRPGLKEGAAANGALLSFLPRLHGRFFACSFIA